MKLNTLEKIYVALKFEQPELLMETELLEKARKPILKMLELSASFGL
jgi:quinolinate synthase